MSEVKMVKFGRTLTDREYGKSIATSLLKEGVFPIALDFSGVISLGSSCGDEILNAVATRQNREIEISHANQPVRSCLEKVAVDSKVKLKFLP